MAQVNDISKMDEYEIVELFRKTMKEYVDTFNERLPRKVNNEYVIGARFSCGSYIDFYIDYGTIKRLYTKEEAKIALNTFNEYCNILVLYLETLKFKYPDIRYEIGKTELSSAKIGKSLNVYEFPFKLPNEYYEDGNYI